MSDATQKQIVKIKFEGIDGWNRPIFKKVGSNIRFGDVNNLFAYDSDEFKKALPDYKKDPNSYLEYFGTSFGCEPHGGLNANILLQIID